MVVVVNGMVKPRVLMIVRQHLAATDDEKEASFE